MELLTRMADNRAKAGVTATPVITNGMGMSQVGAPPTFRQRKMEIIDKKPAKKVVLRFFEDLIESMIESDSDID